MSTTGSASFFTESATDLRAKLQATQFVLAERERELLILKGPCSFASCPLHYAHYGPCTT